MLANVTGASLFELDLATSGSSQPDIYPHDLFFDYNDDDGDDDDFWMSPHLKHSHHPQSYMQAARSPALPLQSASAYQDFYLAPGFDGEWPAQGAHDAFNPFAFNQSSNSKFRQHQRALSTSTSASQATTASPGHPAPLYANNHLDPSAGRPFSHNQYYPTPSHTPIQDTFMERSLSRRSATGNPSASIHASQSLQKNFANALPQQPTSQPQQMPVFPMQDYPNTPNTVNSDMGDRRYYVPSSHPIPRLEHTMTEACADTLYNPQVSIPPPQYPQNQHMNQTHLQPTGVQILIQQAHKARSKSPANGSKQRQTSPFVEGSAFAAEPVQTAARQRLSQKWQDDEYQRWRHLSRGAEVAQQQPKTISPKDAYVDDFHDPAEDAAAGIFPESAGPSQQLFLDNTYRSNFGMAGAGARFPPSGYTFTQPSIPASASMNSSSGDFKFTPLRRTESSSDDTPAHLVSMETSKSEPESSQDSLPPPQPQHRPTSGTISAADTGTYSCTYAGCPQRFATPALLQRHKREVHRSNAAHGVTSRTTTQSPHPEDSGSGSPGTPLNRNSQAGPHRCDRINPSTNKPCNTVFSRPYDLTRHEDTIHARRPKATCQFCLERGEEKTFSRADALTRHLRVVHPEKESYGKAARRRG